MKKLISSIKYDLCRSIVRKSYWCKIFLIATVCLISQPDILRTIYYGHSLKGYDIIGIYNFIIHYDRFKIVLLVIIASIYGNSYCVDFNSHSLKYIVIKSNLKIYIISKCLAISISSIIAYAGGIIIYFLLLSIKIPLVETKDNLFPASTYASFENLTPFNYPLLWIILTSFLFILSILALCMAGFYISIYWPDTLVAICFPTIIYFSLISATFFFPEIFYLPSYGNNVVLISSNPWINYFYKIWINIIVIVLFTVLSYFKLRSKGDEGTI